jgi:hypothetical protein
MANHGGRPVPAGPPPSSGGRRARVFEHVSPKNRKYKKTDIGVHNFDTRIFLIVL